MLTRFALVVHRPGRAPHGHWPTVSRRLLLSALLGLSVLGLLVVFGQVVRGAVQQGQLRHEATARHSAATWRCQAMRSPRQRDACLAELNAPQPQEALASTLPP